MNWYRTIALLFCTATLTWGCASDRAFVGATQLAAYSSSGDYTSFQPHRQQQSQSSVQPAPEATAVAQDPRDRGNTRNQSRGQQKANTKTKQKPKASKESTGPAWDEALCTEPEFQTTCKEFNDWAYKNCGLRTLGNMNDKDYVDGLEAMLALWERRESVLKSHAACTTDSADQIPKALKDSVCSVNYLEKCGTFPEDMSKAWAAWLNT